MNFNFVGRLAASIQTLSHSISQEISYLTNLNDNIETLERGTNELKSMHEYVQANIRDSISVGKLLVPRVDDWLKDVGDFMTEVESIRSQFDERQTCLKGCCTDHFSRYRLGKRVLNKTKDARKLIEKGSFDKVSITPPRSRVLEMQISPPRQIQSTIEQTLEEIWQSFHDEENAIICVYGIGGIGKTTLMKALNNRLRNTGDFSTVIWVTVSRDLNLEFIQKRIGSQLDIKFDFNEGINEKSHKLFARLKTIRYMLILDDLWEAFSLDDIGIPRPDKQNRCKIAIATRSIEVCNYMGADKKIKVNTLTEEEAWSLFHEIAGSVVLLPEIQPLAEEVVKKCSGLPLAIKALGIAMRRMDKKVSWENVLRALKSRAVSEYSVVEDEVFPPLKRSYDRLEDPELQSCFLYCSLFPENYEISTEELARYWAFEEGMIDNDTNTLQEALKKGYAIIERLKDSCLLEEVPESNQHVKMHPLIRDVAIWIASSSSPSTIHATKFLVKAGEGLEHPPEENMWEGVRRISLMKNEIESLQIKPDCRNLATLLLRGNSRLDRIDNSFFQSMPQLRILDLSYTSIRSLPVSLSLLVNLRALICCGCVYLEEIPPLGQLKDLQLLDLSNCGIKSLPEGIADLVMLRQLHLDRGSLTRFPCNLISRLTFLEDLTLSGYDKCGEATLREAANSSRLTALRISLSK